jgi:C4-type Zn-finger protein
MKSRLDALKFIEPKEDLKEGSRCPNCLKGLLKSSYAYKSTYENRYVYFLFCDGCKFKYLKKFGVTGSGKIKDIGFTETEFREAQKLVR